MAKKKTLQKTLRDRAGDLVDTMAPHVESARERAVPVLTDARDAVGPALLDARDRALPLLADARDKAAPYVADARDRATPYLADARGKAAPYVTPVVGPVVGKAGPVLSEARERFTSDVVPAVTAALAALDEGTEDVRAEAKRRGRAVVAAAAAKDQPAPVTHRTRNALVALGLGGVLFAVLRKVRGGSAQTTAWQSSYTPPPAPAAADPAETVADHADTPRDATTPDHPVTEVELNRTDQP